LQKNTATEVSHQVGPGQAGHPASGSGRAAPSAFKAWPGSLRFYNKLQKLFFEATSRLTDRYPIAGSRLIESTVRPLASHPLLAAVSAQHNRRVMHGLSSFRRFLVVPDVHIGDAVMSQSALTALRDFFPDARVDYIVNRTAHSLIDGNPEATRTIPFFSSGTFPSGEALAALKRMIQVERYDLVLNFCPYIDDKDIGLKGIRMLNFLSYAPVILKNERRPYEINHFTSLTYRFVRDSLSRVAGPLREERFMGLRLTITDKAFDEAGRFAKEAGLQTDEPVIMYNPDAASPFTRMPFDKQASLLASLARLNTKILVGAGHTESRIGHRLISSLEPRLRSLTRIVPASLSLAAYSALLDLSDIFITGDTGPLHLAAARKYSASGGRQFRNRTAVLSLFGATPARMSGYDSSRPGYLPANQDAPSRAYTAQSPCRNSTCVNKTFKTCRFVRCFDGVDIDGLTAWTEAYLRTLLPRATMPLDAAETR
jgi:ADP-heptose:LPS heptosyltransferase